MICLNRLTAAVQLHCEIDLDIGLPARLLLLVRPLPPVRHVATGAAIELLGNAVVTSWANTPIVLFGFHCLALSFKFICVS
jgi:hypothetical protein